MRIEDYAAIVAAGFWLAQVALSGAGRDDFGAGA